MAAGATVDRSPEIGCPLAPSTGRLAERSEATRRALLASARMRFSEQGFTDTTIEDIARRAGVTRGALYHHFSSKEELFQAVYEQLEAELADRSAAAALTAEDPIAQLRRGISAFLDACLEPDVQRIVLLDGLSVLGWEAWHELGTRYSFGLLQVGLRTAMEAGVMEPRPVTALAHVLQGALVRAGMVIARAPDPDCTRTEMGVEVETLLVNLTRPAASSPGQRAGP